MLLYVCIIIRIYIRLIIVTVMFSFKIHPLAVTLTESACCRVLKSGATRKLTHAGRAATRPASLTFAILECLFSAICRAGCT